MKTRSAVSPFSAAAVVSLAILLLPPLAVAAPPHAELPEPTWVATGDAPKADSAHPPGHVVLPEGRTFPAAPGWRTSYFPTHPSARWGAASAYDPLLGAMVLFGGRSSTGLLNDSWAFGGTPGAGSWRPLSLVSPPSPRMSASLAYDPSIGQLVLFGGRGSGGATNSTWVLRPSGWAALTNIGPPARWGAGMVFDPGQGALVLFGGRNGSVFFNDSWKLSNGVWSRLSLAEPPTARSGATFQFDPGRGGVVLSGGEGAGGALTDSWLWSGGLWTPEPGWGPGIGSIDGVGVFDGTDAVLVTAGGNLTNGPASRTFELASSGGWAVPPLGSELSPRGSPAASYVPSVAAVVLFGGWNHSASAETWLFSTATPPPTWRVHNVSPMPSPRQQGAMAYDPLDGYLVLFGGQNRATGPLAGPSPAASSVLNDTWSFRNGAWTQLFPNPAPSPRFGAMIAFDPLDGYLVLFGGAALTPTNKTVYLNDTWTFRGGSWSLLSPSGAPSPRRNGAVGFDATDGYVLLYGGQNGTPSSSSFTFFSDTWSFNGGAWTHRTPTGSVPALAHSQAAYDPTSGAIILNGGFRSGPAPGSMLAVGYTFSYRADRWTNLSGALASNVPAARAGASFDFDPALGGLVLLGGTNGTSGLFDVWIFRGGLFARQCSNCSLRLHDTDQVALDEGSGALVAFGIDTAAGGAAETWLNLSHLTAQVDVTPSSVDLGFPCRGSALVGGGVAPLTVGWSFDDGSSSGNLSVNHTFGSAGNHSATFTVTDALGAASTTTIPIVVSLGPQVSLTVTPWGPGTMSARLTANVTGGAGGFRYAFSFGDGGSANSTSASITHLYAAAGNFTASVQAVDLLNQSASAVAVPIALPSVLPSVSLLATPGGLAPPGVILLTAPTLDPYGSLRFAWALNSSPAQNVTHFQLRPSGANASVVLAKTLPVPAELFAWVNLTDGANFSVGARLNLSLYPSFSGGILDTVLGSIACPIRANSTEIALQENITGGADPLRFDWQLGTLRDSGPNITANFTPGTSVGVTLRVTDAAGDNFTVLRTVLIPAATCAPSSGLPGGIVIAGLLVVILLAIVVVLEVLHLHRRRSARPPPPPVSPPAGSAVPPGAPTERR